MPITGNTVIHGKNLHNLKGKAFIVSERQGKEEKTTRK